MLTQQEQDEIMRLARLASIASKRAATARQTNLSRVSAKVALAAHERALDRLRDYLKEVG